MYQPYTKYQFVDNTASDYQCCTYTLKGQYRHAQQGMESECSF